MKKKILMSASIILLLLGSYFLGSFNQTIKAESNNDNIIDMSEVIKIETDGNGNYLLTFTDGTGYYWGE